MLKPLSSSSPITYYLSLIIYHLSPHLLISPSPRHPISQSPRHPVTPSPRLLIYIFLYPVYN
ncbi:MAG TPA: hypothetical protein PLT90_01600, partial [Bacteroidales bacterium]|nr:hypothetical protein [Bacteroidales bacterium]